MLVIILGGVFGFLFVDKAVMPKFTDLQNRNDIVVPSFTDMDVNAATQKAYDLGLRIIKKEREYSNVKPFNTVISQTPTAGENVKKGRHVFVVLSNGAEVGTIPNIENLAEGPAKSALRQAGFENISVSIRYDYKIPAQSAIETTPSAGNKTSRDVPIVLFMSKGQKPTHASVPNLVGEMFSQVQSIIDEKGLKLGKIRYETSSVLSAGQVISQSLAPGIDVPLESYIDVVVTTEK
jgi:serine/threonine-protein kinase